MPHMNMDSEVLVRPRWRDVAEWMLNSLWCCPQVSAVLGKYLIKSQREAFLILLCFPAAVTRASAAAQSQLLVVS